MNTTAANDCHALARAASPGGSPRRSTALFATIDGWRDHLQSAPRSGCRPHGRDTRPGRRGLRRPRARGRRPHHRQPASSPHPGCSRTPTGISRGGWAGPAGIRRLATIDDPSNDQFRDYTTLEWWRVPGAHGRAAPHRPVRRLRLHRRLHGDDHDAGGRRRTAARRRRHRRPRRSTRARAAAAPARGRRPIAVVNASGRIVTVDGLAPRAGLDAAARGAGRRPRAAARAGAAVGQSAAAGGRRGDRVRRHLAALVVGL